MGVKSDVGSADSDYNVRTTRAYLAGFGTAGSLLAASAVLFTLASAVVSFKGWPEVSAGAQRSTVVISARDASATTAQPAANRRVLTAFAGRTANAHVNTRPKVVHTQPPAASHRIEVSLSPITTTPTTSTPAATTPATSTTTLTTTKPSAATHPVSSVANVNLGNVVSGAGTGLATTVNHVSSGLTGTVTGLTSGLANTVSKLSPALGQTVNSVSNVVTTVLSGVTGTVSNVLAGATGALGRLLGAGQPVANSGSAASASGSTGTATP